MNDIFNPLNIVLKNKVFFMSLAGLAIALSIVLQLALPKHYDVASLILPLTPPSHSLSTQLAASINLPFGLGDSFTNNETGMYKEILQSLSINERVIKECNAASTLLPNAPTKPTERDYLQAASKLAKQLNVTLTKGKLIRISLNTKLDPELSSCLVNAYTPSLSKYLEEKGYNRSKARRLSLEKQIQLKKEELTQLTQQLVNFSEESRVITLGPKFAALLDEFSAHLQKKSKLETQASFFKAFFPNRKGLIHSTETEIAKLTQAIESLKIPSSIVNVKGSTDVSFQKSPLLSLYYLQLKERQDSTRKILQLISQQLEMAHVEEAETKSRFEVVDAAFVPFEASFPSLKVNFILLFVLLNAFGFVWLYYRKQLKNLL